MGRVRETGSGTESGNCYDEYKRMQTSAALCAFLTVQISFLLFSFALYDRVSIQSSWRFASVNILKKKEPTARLVKATMVASNQRIKI